MESKLVWVIGDYWEGIYIDGKLQREDHRISRLVLIAVMNKYRIIHAEAKDLNEIGVEWLNSEGSLPELLNDIPNEYFY